jgi:N-acetylneuraminate synthase
MLFFSSAFDPSGVEFLERMQVPAHKIASPELVDLPLIQTMARTGKPLILSTGMATLAEIEEAVNAARAAGAKEVLLLRCNSGYPAPPDEMNLRSILELREHFHCPVGLSDHTPGHTVAVASVALGACMIEKHFTLSRAEGGPDAAFSMEPAEFKALAQAVRTAESAMGSPSFGPTAHERSTLRYRRSLFVVKDVAKGELLTEENVRSIRPADGLHPRHLPQVLGKRAARDLAAGTPLDLNMIES